MPIASLKASVERIDKLLSVYGEPPTPVLSLASEIQADFSERLPGLTDEQRFRIAEWEMDFQAQLTTAVSKGIKDPRLTHTVWAFAVVACRLAAPLRPTLNTLS